MDQSLSGTVQSHVIYQMICAENLKNHYSLIWSYVALQESGKTVLGDVI